MLVNQRPESPFWMGRLVLDFKLQADDALHRQISA
jgi:hypothetical protein